MQLMTLPEFAAKINLSVKTCRTRCNSKIYRDNKIARRDGRAWLVDWDKYRKVVWGEK